MRSRCSVRFLALLLVGLVGLMGCAGVVTQLPAPVELQFADFFQRPVGPRGLEPTPTLLALDGKRVRISGYMVSEEEPSPGAFMLAPVPTSLAEVADGPADYLPGATLFVQLPERVASQTIEFRPGLWSLTGTLELGAREEPNGRVSYVRLSLLDLSAIGVPIATKPALEAASREDNG